MRCLSCGGTFKNKSGSLIIEDAIIGSFTVHGIEYSQCGQCAKLRYPSRTAKTIEEKKEQIKTKLIGRLPVSEFIGAVEVSTILGISRQALNKHRRIKNGFIYSFKSKNRSIYHIKSVELFKQTGDGRFPLHNHPTNQGFKYIIIKTQTPKPLAWESIMSPVFNRDKKKLNPVYCSKG